LIYHRAELNLLIRITLALILNTDNKVMNITPVIRNLLLLVRGKSCAKSDLLRNKSRRPLIGALLILNTDNKVMNIIPIMRNLLLLGMQSAS